MAVITDRAYSGQSWTEFISQLAREFCLSEPLSAPLEFQNCQFTCMDMSDADLSAHGFVDCVFDEVNFRGAILDEAHWRRVRAQELKAYDLSALGACFENCNFSNSDWANARLSGAKFNSCKLVGCNFSRTQPLDIHFEESNLSFCMLRKMSFRHQHLKGIDFSEADLSDTDFRDAILERCSLRGVNLTNARFQGADLRGADLGAINVSNCAPLRGATISTAQAGIILGGLGLNVE